MIDYGSIKNYIFYIIGCVLFNEQSLYTFFSSFQAVTDEWTEYN